MLFRDQFPVVKTTGNIVWGDVFVCSLEDIYLRFKNMFKTQML